MPGLQLPESATESGPGAAGRRRRLAGAAAWAACGALAAGGSWALGLLAARYALGFAVLAAPLDGRVAVTAGLMAGAGGGCGFLAGAAAGLLRGRVDRAGTAIGWGLGAAATGMVGGGLAPLMVVAAPAGLPTELSSAAGWAVAGLLAGVVGYGHGRRPADPDEEEEDGPPAGRRSERPRSSARRAGSAGVAGRLLPVLAVSAACLVAVSATPPSTAGWAVLAVGLLGLAVAWALAGQERRIGELERELREREGRG